MMKEPKNLLIVRTDRIGDVVLSLPLSAIVKKKYSDCKITFLLRKYTTDLAVNYKYIDEILVLSEQNGKPLLIENIKLLKAKNFDSVLVVAPTFINALIVFLSAIPLRIGTGYRWYSFFFNRKVFEHRKNALRHELEYNVNMLAKLGIHENVSVNDLDFSLNVLEEVQDKVRSYLKSKNISISKQIIIVHPGSGGSAIDLPVEKMKSLIIKIASNLECTVILTGSFSEIELCESLATIPNVFNLAGEFDLKELVALINCSSIFVANSTGPLHIAAALNKYIIAFYPKILACSPQRWGPYTIKKTVYTPEIKCSNCTKEQCQRLNCMDSINIDSVFANIEKINKLHLNNGEINVE